jgi:DNA (cytosine-5)-methyltransferase 1
MIHLLAVDNFAGGGGASTGIEMHEANHPQTEHFPEDVFAVDPVKITRGLPVGFAWFSPDCKDFSKAKGGKPVSKKIRGLAWVMVKWGALKRPLVMTLENVEEFKDWGPLLADGRRDPKRKGKTFLNFVARLRNLGYAVEWKQLRGCDYGAPTIRKPGIDRALRWPRNNLAAADAWRSKK